MERKKGNSLSALMTWLNIYKKILGKKTLPTRTNSELVHIDYEMNIQKLTVFLYANNARENS